MSVFKAKQKSMYIHIRKTPLHQHQPEPEEEENKDGDGSGDELMGVFYGISNINALSGLGSSNYTIMQILSYNSIHPRDTSHLRWERGIT